MVYREVKKTLGIMLALVVSVVLCGCTTKDADGVPEDALVPTKAYASTQSQEDTSPLYGQDFPEFQLPRSADSSEPFSSGKEAFRIGDVVFSCPGQMSDIWSQMESDKDNTYVCSVSSREDGSLIEADSQFVLDSGCTDFLFVKVNPEDNDPLAVSCDYEISICLRNTTTAPAKLPDLEIDCVWVTMHQANDIWYRGVSLKSAAERYGTDYPPYKVFTALFGMSEGTGEAAYAAGIWNPACPTNYIYSADGQRCVSVETTGYTGQVVRLGFD